jgi:hypothetical protein
MIGRGPAFPRQTVRSIFDGSQALHWQLHDDMIQQNQNLVPHSGSIATLGGSIL